MITTQISYVPMSCAHCHRAITGNSVMTNGSGLYYHPECYPPMQVAFAQPIDYDRIRQIVREEIAALKETTNGN